MISRTAARSAGPLLCLLLAACSTSNGKWTYPSGRYATTTSSKPAPVSITVTPLVDARGSTNRTYMTWYYIPFFPYGWTDFDRPEATVHGPDTTNYYAEPCEDLAKSLVVELRREGLVREITYAGDYRVLPTATHVLRGRLRSFYVKEERWSYGLSAYAPVFWALLLPMGTSCNGFCADLELVDAKDGRVVWKDSIYDADDYIEGYYYGPEWYRFSWMWERRLRQKLGSLAVALGAEPAPLPSALEEELKQAPPALMPTTLGLDSVEEKQR
jgi:hypothetical protein